MLGARQASIELSSGCMAITSKTHPVILLVEDEELLRLCSLDLLEENGYEVIEAEDADAAFAIMAKPPDVRLLFTDIMPGTKDGMDLARTLAQGEAPDHFRRSQTR